MRGPSQIIRLLTFMSLAAAASFDGSVSATSKPAQPIQDVPQDTLITLERTACYGFCPDYKLTISADGSMTYEGRRFVKKAGTVESSISRERLKELLAAFEKINYFTLRDQYVEPRDGCKDIETDNPSAITSIRINGKSKSVRHYYGCSGVDVLNDLTKLEQAIDDAVNSAQWIR